MAKFLDENGLTELVNQIKNYVDNKVASGSPTIIKFKLNDILNVYDDGSQNVVLDSNIGTVTFIRKSNFENNNWGRGYFKIEYPNILNSTLVFSHKGYDNNMRSNIVVSFNYSEKNDDDLNANEYYFDIDYTAEDNGAYFDGEISVLIFN